MDVPVRVDPDGEVPLPVGMLLPSASGLRGRRAKTLTENDTLVRVDADAEVLRAAGMLILSGSSPGWRRGAALTATYNLVGVDPDAAVPLPVGMRLLSASRLRGRRAKMLTENESMVGVNAGAEVLRAAGMPLPSGSRPGWRRDFLGRSLLRRGGEERRGFRLGIGQGEEVFALIRRMERFHVRGDFKKAQDGLVRAGCGGNCLGRREGRGHVGTFAGDGGTTHRRPLGLSRNG
ncbi:hypothetical protein [Dongia sp. agr-C8]